MFLLQGGAFEVVSAGAKTAVFRGATCHGGSLNSTLLQCLISKAELVPRPAPRLNQLGGIFNQIGTPSAHSIRMSMQGLLCTLIIREVADGQAGHGCLLQTALDGQLENRYRANPCAPAAEEPAELHWSNSLPAHILQAASGAQPSKEFHR